ncbi:MAG: hypothetical protein M1824_001585 [Vezdaea acicularis]|nr:MAG: hypothetical protein M1824_001585 [Vezdaea acicularis]
MFTRRRGQPINQTPNASAASAAAQAFLSHRTSTTSLSAAAAAAALRSHTTSPVPVGDIQTKRTVRRQASTSSQGSAHSDGRNANGRTLQRRGSSGSLTERTFRGPSPNRSGPRASTEDAPPVPPLPSTDPAPAPPIPLKSRKRASSATANTPRVASPPPNAAHGRGVSLDRSPAEMASRIAAKRVTSLASLQELERTGSRGSVNFSYPIRNTPPTSPNGERRLTQTSGGKPAESTMDALGPAEVARIQSSLQDVANKPARKKKKRIMAVAPSDAALIAGQRANDGPSQLSGKDATLSGSPNAKGLEVPVATPKKKKKKKVVAVTDDPGIPRSSPSPRHNKSPSASSMSDLGSIPEAEDIPATRSKAVKLPPPVFEDKEAEEEEGLSQRGVDRKDALRQLEAGDRDALTANGTSKPSGKTWRDFSQNSSTLKMDVGDAVDKGGEATSKKPNRPPSLSPSRAAHFSAAPTLVSSEMAKHHPPSRSLSPGKSAMKNSPSSRTSSPATHGHGGAVRHSYAASDASEPGSMPSEDGGLSATAKRKKNARVSFEEDAVVLGEAAGSVTTDSPVLMSPQNKDPSKRTWFGLGRGKKKSDSSSAEVEEENLDDMMKPRPALPSFGSVRGRKEKTDAEDAREKATPADPSTVSTVSTSSAADATGISSDHAIGGILSKDLSSRNSKALNSTAVRDPNDPLPPEVLSVEHVLDESSANESDYSGEDHIAGGSDVERPKQDAPKVEDHAASYRELADQLSGDSPGRPSIEMEVPSIAVVQATPTIEQSEARKSWIGTPGQSPRTENGSAEAIEKVSHTAAHHATEPTPATLGISEPEPAEAAANHDPSTPVVGHVAESLRSHSDSHDEGSTDSDSEVVYSDAAEDLSDLEGDGFGSINAIVESPVVDTAPGLAITTPPESPSIAAVRRQQVIAPTLHAKDDHPEPPADEGWDRAQQYWKSLSTERRQEMEQAALSGADDESPDVLKSKPKKKKKKVVPKKVLTAAEPEAIARPSEDHASEPPLPPWPDDKYKKAVLAKSTAKKSSPPAKTSRPAAAKAREPKTMRKSMRSAPEPDPEPEPVKTNKQGSLRGGPMRKTMRGGPEAGERAPVRKKNTPRVQLQPLSVPETMPLSANTARHLRTVSQNRSTRTQKPKTSGLGRTVSNGSDSDASASSFKKQRTEGSSSGFARKTMRGPPPSTQNTRDQRPGSPDSTTYNRSSRFSIRSLSPTGTGMRRPFSSSGGTPPVSEQKVLRSSMRSASLDYSSGPTMRGGPKERPKSPSTFSMFSKSSKTKATPASASKKPSRLGSRFADSSGEGEPDQPAFRSVVSRFADSSDEDDEEAGRGGGTATRKFAPVRGIPRRSGAGDGDSTDLPDSDSDTPNAAPSTPKHTPPKANKNHEGQTLASGSLRRSGSGRDFTPSKEKGLSGLQGKKSDAKKKSKGSFFGALGRRKDPTAKSSFKPDIESAARRDTPLERSRFEMQAARHFGGVGEAEDATATPPPPGTPTTTTNKPLLSATAETETAPDTAADPPSSPLTTTPKSLLLGLGSRPGSPRPGSPRPKLQKRNTGSQAVTRLATGGQAEEWPLPPPPKLRDFNDEARRPSSADGAFGGAAGGGLGKVGRPGVGTRRATTPVPFREDAFGGTSGVGVGETAGGGAGEEDGEGEGADTAIVDGGLAGETGEPVRGKGGRKKRFPFLRKVFRLHD